MAVSNYSGYNPVTGTVSWDGGGYSTAVGNYTISGPMTSPTTPATTTAVPEVQQQPQGDPNDLNGNGIPDWFEAQQAAMERQQREAASAFLRNVLTSYGLGSLAGSVDSLIQQWGTNTDVIALKLKDTGEYKARFKGLLALQQRGVTDIRNESEYLALETEYRRAFRENGLADFLGESGSQTEYDKIADLVGKYSVSVNEVRDRISDAQRAAVNTPQEVKDALRDFYGIDTSQLVSWSLDPEATMSEINRRVNAGLAGGYAAQAGLGIGSGTAEQIADLAGTGDLNVGQLNQDMQRSREVNDATQRLAFIDNETLTGDDVVQSTLGLSADAQKKVGTLQSRERARFSGSSAVRTGSLSRNI